MDKELIDLSQYRLEKAQEDLDTANPLFINGKYSQSLNRSYYAMFHSARSLLAMDRFDSKKHSGVISYFNLNYIKTGKLEERYGKMLLNAEKIRVNCDYKDFYLTGKDEAEQQLNNAKAFVEMIRHYLELLYKA